MAISIKEIAKISGVGVGTVSRVLNNNGPVSEKTRKKVMEVIEEYGYIPNENARNLKLTKSDNIGLFVKSIANPFFSKMIDELYKAMESRGYNLIVRYVPVGENELEVMLSESIRNSLCGSILFGVEEKNRYTDNKLKQLGTPCVVLTADLPDVDDSIYSSVKINDEQEAYKATKYLIEMGHKKIGVFYQPVPDTPDYFRFKGYRRALEESGIDFDEKLVGAISSNNGVGYRGAFLAMKQLMQANPDMTALFAFSDIFAVGAAKAVELLGKKVPENISIIGFDGIEATEYSSPAIDTIYQPVTEMAETTISLLHSMINGEPGKHIEFEAVLIKRDSVRRLA